MALTLTNTTLSNPADKSEVEANFTDVATKFGSIDNSDIANSAGIALSKLAASYQEVFLQLRFSCAEHGDWPLAPGDPTAPTNDELMDFVPFPGINGDAWTADKIAWASNDTGTASGSFSLYLGAFDGSGVMASGGAIATSTAMTFKGADLGNQGYTDISVSVTQSDTVRGIYLVSAVQGTAVMDDLGNQDGANTMASWLNVTVALRRQIQA